KSLRADCPDILTCRTAQMVQRPKASSFTRPTRFRQTLSLDDLCADEKLIPEAPEDVVNKTRLTVQKAAPENVSSEEEEERAQQQRQAVPNAQLDPSFSFDLVAPESDSDRVIVPFFGGLFCVSVGLKICVAVVLRYPLGEWPAVTVIERIL